MRHPTRQDRQRAPKAAGSKKTTIEPAFLIETGPDTKGYQHARRAQKNTIHSASALDPWPKTKLRLRQPKTFQETQGPTAPESVWWVIPDPQQQQREKAEAKKEIQQDWLKRLRPRHSRTFLRSESKNK
ncbi:hypothetical protein BBP40_009809 [Aspergillus hancockii]|nr:hypothetical protein BBP40_009809 [Aspergillus hancockii]